MFEPPHCLPRWCQALSILFTLRLRDIQRSFLANEGHWIVEWSHAAFSRFNSFQFLKGLSSQTNMAVSEMGIPPKWILQNRENLGKSGFSSGFRGILFSFSQTFSHIVRNTQGAESFQSSFQEQDPARLEFETYKFNLAWTKMKQVACLDTPKVGYSECSDNLPQKCHSNMAKSVNRGSNSLKENWENRRMKWMGIG